MLIPNRGEDHGDGDRAASRTSANRVGGASRRRALPDGAAATAILNNADVEKKVHLTSLFGTRDLWYNPSRPVTGSDLDLVAARVGERLFSIRGNRQVQEVKDKFLQQAGFVALAQTLDKPTGEPDGAANRSQPVQLGTNSTLLPAGSAR